MEFTGTLIEESLTNSKIFSRVKIETTKIEQVTEKHKTPWLKQWTLHTVSIDSDQADEIAEEIAKSLDYSHGSAWYADFKNDKTHYVIYKDKIFKINRNEVAEYQTATDYGISLGIPSYQVDFAPDL